VTPKFQGSADRLLESRDYAVSRWTELDERQANAIAQATERHAQERAGAGSPA
jgi:limonene 1,2-monooxygenase